MSTCDRLPQFLLNVRGQGRQRSFGEFQQLLNALSVLRAAFEVISFEQHLHHEKGSGVDIT